MSNTTEKTYQSEHGFIILSKKEDFHCVDYVICDKDYNLIRNGIYGDDSVSFDKIAQL